MAFLSVKDTAAKWGLSERSVRNYCQSDRIAGAFLIGKTWSIPDDATKPTRKPVPSNKPRTLAMLLA